MARGTTASYTLESKEIAVIVVPDEGGRIASLKSITTGVEFLTQTERKGSWTKVGFEASFRLGACAGVEECLPTVGPCGLDTVGGPAPDHGDFWQIPWSVTQADGSVVTIEAEGFSRSLRFRKTFAVEGDTLRVNYWITNVGGTSQSFLYACHPLFAIEEGDSILLPDEVRFLRLDYSRESRLGMRGDQIRWPALDEDDPLSRASGAETGNADMLYTGRLTNGVCGIERRSTNQCIEISFPVERLPYLGVWLCYGGWPDDETEYRQYAVALEPTTAPWNTLTEAQAAGVDIAVAPGATYAFQIDFRIVSQTSSHTPHVD